MDETYARILKNLPPEIICPTIRLLQFLTYSERPLRIDEAVDIIAVNLKEQPRFKLENRMPIPEEIMKYCSSLAVRVGRKDEYGNETIGEIQLAHFSVKDYLTSDRTEEHIAQPLQETVACSSIAKVCLAYLLEVDEGLRITEIRQSFFLAQYAARYWASYAAIAKRDSQMDVHIMEFLGSSAYPICYQLYAPDEPWNEDRQASKEIRVAPALYYVSFAGLSHYVELLLDEGADVHAQGGRYGNALQAASAQGHKDIVQILLNEGADVNTKGGEFYNALTAASFGGHKEVVQILVHRGADVSAESGIFGTNALWAASVRRDKEIIQILIKACTNIDPKRGHYDEALYVASENGYTEIVQLLVEAGVNVNTEIGCGANALQAASDEGHEKIVQILQNVGAVDSTAEKRKSSAAWQDYESQKKRLKSDKEKREKQKQIL